eukprot:5340288-Ditylum_brightwellii.AAC.1
MNFTTTEKELLAIVETLKEFRNILLGQRITVYTDHKNLTYTNFNTERVVCWRMVAEDYGPELIYIQGNDNVVTNARSRLFKKKAPDLYTIADYYGNEQLSEDIYPVQFKLLQIEQQKDKKLTKKVKISKASYKIKDLLG